MIHFRNFTEPKNAELLVSVTLQNQKNPKCFASVTLQNRKKVK